MLISPFIKKYLDGKSLKARAVSGGIWLGVGSGIEQGLRLVRNMILARILAPDAFGLMAIILAVNAAFESFTQVGIKEAVIQNTEGEEDTYLNGAWWLSFGRSVGLFILGVISAPWISNFYGISNDVIILQISFLSILFNGAMSARAYLAVKRMEYGKWVIISSGGGICGIITAIVCSFLLRNVWALVVGFIVEAGARFLLSFLICPFIPKLKFKRKHLHELFKYARGIFGLPILYLIFMQTDIFVIGKLFSKADLGLYSLAASLAQVPTQLITTLLNPILLPVFANRQDDKVWINQALIKSTKFIALLWTPVAFFIFLYGQDILSVIYSKHYAVVAVPFAILFANALIRTCSAPITNVYFAIGRPDLQRFFTGIRAVLMVILIYPAIKLFGLTGAAAAGLIALIISYCFQVWQINGLTKLDQRQYSNIFLQAVGISLPVLVVWYYTYNLFSSRPLINILQGIMGSLLVYGILGTLFIKLRKTVVLPQ